MKVRDITDWGAPEKECPVCDGVGLVQVPDGEATISGSDVETCRECDGKGVVP